MSCGNGGRKCTRDRLQLIGGRIHFGPSHLRGAGSVGVGPELYDLHTATGVNYIPRYTRTGERARSRELFRSDPPEPSEPQALLDTVVQKGCLPVTPFGVTLNGVTTTDSRQLRREAAANVLEI